MVSFCALLVQFSVLVSCCDCKIGKLHGFTKGLKSAMKSGWLAYYVLGTTNKLPISCRVVVRP